MMALIEGICPPSRETWELVMAVWKFFPVVSYSLWLLLQVSRRFRCLMVELKLI
jgi:hypothetical protein